MALTDFPHNAEITPVNMVAGSTSLALIARDLAQVITAWDWWIEGYVKNDVEYLVGRGEPGARPEYFNLTADGGGALPGGGYSMDLSLAVNEVLMEEGTTEIVIAVELENALGLSSISYFRYYPANAGSVGPAGPTMAIVTRSAGAYLVDLTNPDSTAQLILSASTYAGMRKVGWDRINKKIIFAYASGNRYTAKCDLDGNNVEIIHTAEGYSGASPCLAHCRNGWVRVAYGSVGKYVFDTDGNNVSQGYTYSSNFTDLEAIDGTTGLRTPLVKDINSGGGIVLSAGSIGTNRVAYKSDTEEFFAARSNSPYEIRLYNSEMSSYSVVVPERPNGIGGICYDERDGKLYYTYGQSIRRCNPDGTGVETLVNNVDLPSVPEFITII